MRPCLAVQRDARRRALKLLPMRPLLPVSHGSLPAHGPRPPHQSPIGIQRHRGRGAHTGLLSKYIQCGFRPAIEFLGSRSVCAYTIFGRPVSTFATKSWRVDPPAHPLPRPSRARGCPPPTRAALPPATAESAARTCRLLPQPKRSREARPR